MGEDTKTTTDAAASRSGAAAPAAPNKLEEMKLKMAANTETMKLNMAENTNQMKLKMAANTEAAKLKMAENTQTMRSGFATGLAVTKTKLAFLNNKTGNGGGGLFGFAA